MSPFGFPPGEHFARSAAFLRELPLELREEGGDVDNPADPGGRTHEGVTQTVYDAYRVTHGLALQDVYRASDDEVEDVYLTGYWIPGRCDALPWPLSQVHFDACINHGVHQAALFLQRAVGVEDDGDIGPATIGACLPDAPAKAKNYVILRRQFYRDLAAKRPASAVFLPGWQKRMDHLATACGLV